MAVAESLVFRRGQRITPRRELAGLAGAALVAAVSGGMPVAGSFLRSIVNFDAGTRTLAGGAWGALAMALATALLASLDVAPFRQARHYACAEWLLICSVALLTACVGVEAALAVGVDGSIALLLQRTARPYVALIGRMPGTQHFRNVERHAVEPTSGVVQFVSTRAWPAGCRTL